MTNAAYFRQNGTPNAEMREELRAYLQRGLSLTDDEHARVISYLATREREVKGKDTFGIVYDVTRFCNLECAHCCVNAVLVPKDGKPVRWETTTEQVKMILRRLADYTSHKDFPNVFLIFGGGEPTMRPDFEEIAQYASGLFGVRGLGVNTNATYLNAEKLLAIERFFGFIEISIDGFEAYHNLWRNPKNRVPVLNPFNSSLSLVEAAVKDSSLRNKLEVSSAVTTDNLKDLPSFARFLSDLGVQNYSIHRAMPVGRMAQRLDKIPSMRQYIELLIAVSDLRETTRLKGLHLHHSLESIYSVLFLGRDIHHSPLLTGSARHSIGLDPHGNVYFDPWCVVPPFNKLAAGNLLDEGIDVEQMLEGPDSLIRLADEISKKQLRCRSCRMECSGGMRFNALGHYVARGSGKITGAINITQLVGGLSEIDPACPLYED